MKTLVGYWQRIHFRFLAQDSLVHNKDRITGSLIMFCGECGTENPDTNSFCKNCGKPLRRPQQAPQPAAVPVPQAATPPPAYTPPIAGHAPAAAVPAGAPAVAKPSLNKGLLALGIVGFILAIVSWFFYPYLCGIAAVILGGVTFYKTENKIGIVAIIAIVAGVIGIASMAIGYFYLVLFPPSMGFEAVYWLMK